MIAVLLGRQLYVKILYRMDLLEKINLRVIIETKTY